MTVVGQFMYKHDAIGWAMRMLASGVLEVKGLRVRNLDGEIWRGLWRSGRVGGFGPALLC